MHHPTVKIAHTTAFVTPVVEHCLEREILWDGVCKRPLAANRERVANVAAAVSFIYLVIRAV